MTFFTAYKELLVFLLCSFVANRSTRAQLRFHTLDVNDDVTVIVDRYFS